MSTEKRLIGYVTASSGQLMIVDPEDAKRFKQVNYEEVSTMEAGESFYGKLGRVPAAVVLRTNKDAKCPVFLHSNSEGKPIAITIEFE